MPPDKLNFILPDGACDCHMHVYAGAGKVEAPFPVPAAGIEAYKIVMRRLGLSRVVIVQSMLYGTDNSCMIDAIRTMGSAARGVAVVGRRPGQTELEKLTKLGVRGARAFMLDGGPYDWTDLPDLAPRIHEFGWHLQIQLDGRRMEEVAPLLLDLACPIVIDHVGKFLEPVGVGHPSVTALRRMLTRGRCWVKLSGIYETSRSGPPDYADVSKIARLLASEAPERMLWGSNWPHPNKQPPPDDFALLNHFAALTLNEKARAQILVENPACLFDFPPIAVEGRHGVD